MSPANATIARSLLTLFLLLLLSTLPISASAHPRRGGFASGVHNTTYTTSTASTAASTTTATGPLYPHTAYNVTYRHRSTRYHQYRHHHHHHVNGSSCGNFSMRGDLSTHHDYQHNHHHHMNASSCRNMSSHHKHHHHNTSYHNITSTPTLFPHPSANITLPPGVRPSASSSVGMTKGSRTNGTFAPAIRPTAGAASVTSTVYYA